ncbi:hypothetical protein ACH41H_45440 [Streptomyces sp. NPDC020800]|uniref:hypothetical protein n=1 Tax=Streptomyces sp. NPDC020800 TaxID=3365092 RepID=UPI0037BCEA1F
MLAETIVVHRGKAFVSRAFTAACGTLGISVQPRPAPLPHRHRHRPHEGLRHPLMPRKALTSNRMWATLIAVTGYMPPHHARGAVGAGARWRG